MLLAWDRGRRQHYHPEGSEGGPAQGGNQTLKVIAINGSPRKKWNTAMLLEKALEGASSAGAETELIHLYDLDFKGCISCFACKTLGGKSYGRCAVKDGLAPVLDRAAAADALILGSPIYFGSATGEMRSFMERLLFPVPGLCQSPPIPCAQEDRRRIHLHDECTGGADQGFRWSTDLDQRVRLQHGLWWLMRDRHELRDLPVRRLFEGCLQYVRCRSEGEETPGGLPDRLPEGFRDGCEARWITDVTRAGVTS